MTCLEILRDSGGSLINSSQSWITSSIKFSSGQTRLQNYPFIQLVLEMLPSDGATYVTRFQRSASSAVIREFNN